MGLSARCTDSDGLKLRSFADGMYLAHCNFNSCDMFSFRGISLVNPLSVLEVNKILHTPGDMLVGVRSVPSC